MLVSPINVNLCSKVLAKAFRSQTLVAHKLVPHILPCARIRVQSIVNAHVHIPQMPPCPWFYINSHIPGHICGVSLAIIIVLCVDALRQANSTGEKQVFKEEDL